MWPFPTYAALNPLTPLNLVYLLNRLNPESPLTDNWKQSFHIFISRLLYNVFIR